MLPTTILDVILIKLNTFKHLLTNRLHLYRFWGQFTVAHYRRAATLSEMAPTDHDIDDGDGNDLVSTSCTFTLCQLPFMFFTYVSHLIFETL